MVEVMKNLRCVGRVLLAAAVLGAPVHALAADCRTIQSVKDSFPVDSNTGAGGHVTQHVLGKRPPGTGTDSQLGKSLFTSPEAYLGVWRNYVSSDKVPELNCSGTSKFQEVPVKTLTNNDVIGAFACDSVNPDGTCKDMRRKQCSTISFGYILRGSTWVLNTAYPSGC